MIEYFKAKIDVDISGQPLTVDVYYTVEGIDLDDAELIVVGVYAGTVDLSILNVTNPEWFEEQCWEDFGDWVAERENGRLEAIAQERADERRRAA